MQLSNENKLCAMLLLICMSWPLGLMAFQQGASDKKTKEQIEAKQRELDRLKKERIKAEDELKRLEEEKRRGAMSVSLDEEAKIFARELVGKKFRLCDGRYYALLEISSSGRRINLKRECVFEIEPAPEKGLINEVSGSSSLEGEWMGKITVQGSRAIARCRMSSEQLGEGQERPRETSSFEHILYFRKTAGKWTLTDAKGLLDVPSCNSIVR